MSSFLKSLSLVSFLLVGGSKVISPSSSHSSSLLESSESSSSTEKSVKKSKKYRSFSKMTKKMRSMEKFCLSLKKEMAMIKKDNKKMKRKLKSKKEMKGEVEKNEKLSLSQRGEVLECIEHLLEKKDLEKKEKLQGKDVDIESHDPLTFYLSSDGFLKYSKSSGGGSYLDASCLMNNVFYDPCKKIISYAEACHQENLFTPKQIKDTLSIVDVTNWNTYYGSKTLEDVTKELFVLSSEKKVLTGMSKVTGTSFTLQNGYLALMSNTDNATVINNLMPQFLLDGKSFAYARLKGSTQEGVIIDVKNNRWFESDQYSTTGVPNWTNIVNNDIFYDIMYFV